MDQLAIDKIKSLARQAANDPLRAQLLAKEIEREAAKLGLAGGADGGYYRYLRIPNIPALAASPAAGSLFSAGFSRWPQKAIVVGCYGTCIAEAPLTGTGFTSVQFQIFTKGGDKSLILNGAGADFMTFHAAFGSFQNWLPLSEEVTGTDSTWNLSFRNLDTANPHTPDFYFKFIPLPDGVAR
jgi:hypothetical protein